MDPFVVIFSYINLGATEGNASALSNSKEFSGRKLRKVQGEELFSLEGTVHTFCAVLEA